MLMLKLHFDSRYFIGAIFKQLNHLCFSRSFIYSDINQLWNTNCSKFHTMSGHSHWVRTKEGKKRTHEEIRRNPKHFAYKLAAEANVYRRIMLIILNEDLCFVHCSSFYKLSHKICMQINFIVLKIEPLFKKKFHDTDWTEMKNNEICSPKFALYF